MNSCVRWIWMDYLHVNGKEIDKHFFPRWIGVALFLLSLLFQLFLQMTTSLARIVFNFFLNTKVFGNVVLVDFKDQQSKAVLHRSYEAGQGKQYDETFFQ